MIDAPSKPSGATPAAERACLKVRGSTPPEPAAVGLQPLRGRRAEDRNGRGRESLGNLSSATLASPEAGHMRNAGSWIPGITKD